MLDKLAKVASHMEFDFEDEFSSTGAFDTPQQRRVPGKLTGSARKMTTSLDGVLSNMRRHKIIDLKSYFISEIFQSYILSPVWK